MPECNKTFLAKLSDDSTASTGHYGLNLATVIAYSPVFENKMISLAPSMYDAETALLLIESSIDSVSFFSSRILVSKIK